MLKKRFLSYTQLLIITLAGNLFIASCSKNNGGTSNTPTASIMAFNLATDKSTVGFSLSKNNFTNGALAYANFTGVYIKVNTGDKTLESFDYATAATTIASVPVSLKADNFYSVFLVGKGANYKNVVVNDNIDSLSGTSGLAYIRYVNAIVDSVTTPTVSIVSNGIDTVVNETAAFPSVSGFKGVNPGNIKVDVTNSLGLNVSKTITVEQKKVYTILLTGLQNSSTTPPAINSILNGSLDQ
jgi:hypothetical protein